MTLTFVAQSVVAAGGLAHAGAPSMKSFPSGRIVDITETIMIWAPDEWAEVETADPEGEHPHVSAAPSLDEFEEDFGSGVSFDAIATGDEGDEFGALGDTSRCEDYQRVTFDNGVFDGDGRWWTGCGDDDATLIHIDVNSSDPAVNADVLVQAATDAEVDLAVDVLCSIGVVRAGDADSVASTDPDVVATSQPDEPLSVDVSVDTSGTEEFEIRCE